MLIKTACNTKHLRSSLADISGYRDFGGGIHKANHIIWYVICISDSYFSAKHNGLCCDMSEVKAAVCLSSFTRTRDVSLCVR